MYITLYVHPLVLTHIMGEAPKSNAVIRVCICVLFNPKRTPNIGTSVLVYEEDQIYLPDFCDLLNSQCLLLEPVSVAMLGEFEGASYSTYSSRTVVPVN